MRSLASLCPACRVAIHLPIPIAAWSKPPESCFSPRWLLCQAFVLFANFHFFATSVTCLSVLNLIAPTGYRGRLPTEHPNLLCSGRLPKSKQTEPATASISGPVIAGANQADDDSTMVAGLAVAHQDALIGAWQFVKDNATLPID